MKSNIICLVYLSLCFACSTAFGKHNTDSLSTKKAFSVLSNSKLNALPAATLFEKEIQDNVDIAEMALLLESEINPNLNIKKYLTKIDTMVNEVKDFATKDDPISKINSLRVYLFSKFGMSYDFSDPFAEQRRNQTLSGILDTKKGSCMTMPLLFLVLAQRLNYPVYPVLLPNHLFLRYSAFPVGIYNLEVTSDGNIFKSDTFYNGKDYNLTQQGISSGSYMRDLSYKEFLAVLFSYSAQHFFFEKNDYRKGFRYLTTAFQLQKSFANLYMVEAKMFNHLRIKFKREGNKKLETQYSFASQSSLNRAYKLGFARPDPKEKEKYKKEMEELAQKGKKRSLTQASL